MMSEWIEEKDQFSTIKLEQFEDYTILQSFLPLLILEQLATVHVFITNHAGISFDWHHDNCDVLLYILYGQKTIELANGVTKTIDSQQYVNILSQLI